jgi:serine/alanine adding enzyme
MEIGIFKGSGESWNKFVVEQAKGTIYHLYEWKDIIERAYGHKSFYLAASDDKEVVGILPLFRVRSLLFGDQLVSLPFLDVAGVLCEEANIRENIIDMAKSLACELRVDSLSLRHFESVLNGGTDDLEKVDLKLGLEKDIDRMLRKIPSERRNRIKKCEKMGLTATMVGAEGLNDFYRVFKVNMRDLGSPVHSKFLFEEMFRRIKDNVKIALVRFQGITVGAALCLLWKGTIHVPWVSSLRAYFKYYPNILLYWHVMKYGCQNGFAELDFGRSSQNSGTYEFKRQWGADPVQLHWEYYCPKENSSASPHVDKEGPILSLMVKLWQRVPVPVATWIGPTIRKGIIN